MNNIWHFGPSDTYNRYLAIIRNNYTREIRCYELYNETCDFKYYDFPFRWEKDFAKSECDIVLFWCRLECDIEPSSDLLKSKLSVITDEGETVSLKVGHIHPDTNMICFEKQSDGRLKLTRRREWTTL